MDELDVTAEAPADTRGQAHAATDDECGPLLVLDPSKPHPLEVKACPEFFVRALTDADTAANKTNAAPPNPRSLANLKKRGTKKAAKSDQKPSQQNIKNAQRYLLIRNTIVAEWVRIKPKYLVKSGCRHLLKGHGDVHAISRVHEFLERIGAINTNADMTGVRSSSLTSHVLKRMRGSDAVDGDDAEDESDNSGWLTFFKGDTVKRARRVRNSRGEWVDESDLRDGRTIVHGEDGRPISDDEGPALTAAEIQEERRLLLKNAKYFTDEELIKVDPSLLKRKRKQLSQHFYHYGNDDGDMNEFRLIPLEKFKCSFQVDQVVQPPSGISEATPPFRVLVDSNVQMVIDFHSHLADTEIIGLLGGTYDPLEKILYVNEAYPCKSISTTIQCEMDPESEVKAHIHFASRNKVVVGWYHSHPTFDPNPSIRDIETQTDHQHLFLREGDGVEPFVGAIYSPYDSTVEGLVSRSEWMCVGERLSSSGKYRLPYACETTIVPATSLPNSVLKQMFDLVDEYKNNETRVDLSHAYKSETTKLDKLVGSLQIHAFTCIDLVGGSSTGDVGDVMKAAEEFVSKVREKLLQEFSASNVPRK
ncbi:SWIRM domain-containing protein [Chytriomyces sp. MP71]|nr:SWIRM domain-containing protein [Chytriomyces sp. MP71]